MKTFRYKQGKVFELESSDGEFSYIVVVSKNWFSTLFALIQMRYSTRLNEQQLQNLKNESMSYAYINPASIIDGANYRCKYVGIINITCPEDLVFFYGDECSGITIGFPDGKERFINAPLSLNQVEDDLVSKGYIPKVLWLMDDIADYLFKQIPLRWSAAKKY